MGGRGGYADVTLSIKRNQKIYCFVGNAGTPMSGSTSAGGYNGGGAALTCLAGAHSASGGGATHISWSYNPIIADAFARNSGHINAGNGWYIVLSHRWDNPGDCIAIAGGGGGGGYNYSGYPTSYAYAGGTYAGPASCTFIRDGRRGSVPAANNGTGVGYTHGAGQYCINASGAGAGWYGGYTQMYLNPNMKQTSGGNCDDFGGGGTSYINSKYSGLILSGNDHRLYNGSIYQKPYTQGTNGYIKVTKR